MFAHQTVELRDGALVAGVADVPDLDAALAARVHVSRGVADGHRAHHLPVVQGVDLARVPGDSGSDEGIGGERDRLHLAVCGDVEGVRTLGKGAVGEKDGRETEKTFIIKQLASSSAASMRRTKKGTIFPRIFLESIEAKVFTKGANLKYVTEV